MRAGPIAISGLGAIADRFDHVLLDQWGTLHEGRTIPPAARDCVRQLRDAGKRVLALSNSGKRADANARRLAALGLPPEAYDGVLSSGEVTWQGLRARDRAPFKTLGQACFLISRDDDRSVVHGLDLGIVDDVRDADFILLAGLDDAAAQPLQWRDCLAAAATHRVPMLCANPDVVMFGAGALIPAPGALAAFYQSLGGRVTFVGKPHAPIFDAALARLGNPEPKRVLVVGDSLDHDIAGGRAANMLTVLVRSGVHREALADAANLPQAILALAGPEAGTPHWTMQHLAW
jgi:HAD superfamily hydrolase (TIGR01459 family)